jgi:hypothetical protein
MDREIRKKQIVLTATANGHHLREWVKNDTGEGTTCRNSGCLAPVIVDKEGEVNASPHLYEICASSTSAR